MIKSIYRCLAYGVFLLSSAGFAQTSSDAPGAAESRLHRPWGAFLGFSPVVNSQMADELNSDFDNTFDVGMSFKWLQLGYRRGTATVPQFQAPPKGLDQTNMVYSNLAQGKQVFQELYLSGVFTVLDQVADVPELQLNTPVSLGIYSQTIKADGREFGNVAYDLAAGLELKWFTARNFTLSLSTLYHAAIPFWGVRENADSKPIRNPAGNDIQGRHTGLEARLGVGFLFGDGSL